MTGAGITIIRNAGRKPLSKSFKLKDGKLHSEVAAQMSAGTFESRYFEHIDNFSSFLTSGEFGPDTAIAYGMNPAGKGYIAAQDAMNEGTARKGAIARTKENFPYRVGEPGILFGDIDPLAGHEFEDAYHYDRTLYAVVSWWKPFRRIYVPSSSSEIYEEATDKLVSRKAAFHVHGLLDDASQAKPVTDAIFAALIEAGYGRVVCLKNGARVLRSIIDRAVPQGERLDFAFGAHLGKGLRQERFILPMGEQDLLQTGGKGLADFDAWRASSAIVRKLMAQAEPEAKAKKGAFIDEKVEEAAGRGVDRETARRSYERAFSTNSLPPDHLLYPRHGSPFTVGEAVTHPDDYHGMAVCDPLESDYGVTGILYLKGQRVGPTLHSQAHGGQTFRLMAPEPTGKTTHMAPARPAPVAVKGTPVEEPIPSPQPMAGGSNVLKVDLAPKPEARSFASIIQEINELAAKGYDAFDHLTVAIPTEMAAGEYSAAEIDAIFRAIGKAAKCSPASVRKVYTAIRASLQTEQFGGESLDLALARRVLKEHYSGGEDAIYSRQAFRFWNGSYWEEQDNVIVRKHLVAAAEGMGAAEMVRKALIESSMALFNIEAARNPEVQFNPDIGSTFINVANGELHLVGDCWQLRPAKRGHYRTSQIPVVYDPNAVCPVWDGLLESLFRGDDDAEMKRRCLMQMFGYSLLPISAYDRFAILIGAGANGKSVVLNVLRALLGRKNVSAVQPGQLDNRFQRAHLLDKLANIVSEVKRDTTMPDETIKKLVSGDLDTAEHKHKPPFDFCNHATIWLGMNALPKVDDFSDGLFRRAIILTFNRALGVKGQPISATSHRIADEDAKPELRLIERGEGPLAGELPGILNMSLRSIVEFMEAGRIASTPSGDAMLKDWHMNNDQVACFVSEECALGPHYQMSSSEFYQVFLGWAKDHGIIVPLTQTAFSLALKSTAPVEIVKSNGTMRVRGICTHADQRRQDACAQRLEARYA